MALPALPLAWYGDDFTGSTDVLEVLGLAGLSPVLFLRAPDAAALARFPGSRAIGIAGDARARPPRWMDEHLGAAFGSLASLAPAIVHYKVCSTFDSSPHTGSIGRATEIGRAVFRPRGPVPMLVGAPALHRYCLFGNLFATADGETYRLDRHPTMARHPVTPMAEADLRRHLASQTELRVALFDVLKLWSDDSRTALRRLVADAPDVVLFDVADERSLQRCGELIWEDLRAGGFAVASSGLEYALVAHWRAAGLIDRSPPATPAHPVDRLAAVSGSCAPATAAQIDRAEQLGWSCLAADPRRLADPAASPGECGRLLEAADRALAAGRSIVIHTARGPDDPRIAAFYAWARDRLRAQRDDANAAIGKALGTLLRELIERHGLERVVVAGGDTSGAAGAALGIDALTLLSPTSPGSPLCHAHAGPGRVDGISIAFKGGQVGGPDYFEAVRCGSAGGTSMRF